MALAEETTSIGSPSAVPVPCASKARLAASPSRTVETNHLCDDPLGAVKLALGPSCCTAVPRTATLVETSESSKNAPQPSPRQYPSPRRSNVWQRPKAESMPAALNAANAVTSSSPSPHTQALEHSASYRALLATWSATRDAEHAVSTGKHGPVSPSVYEMRPEATAMEVDVPE